MNDITPRWDNHFLAIAKECSRMSKDPSTRVGAVIVGPDKEIRSTGFNGFPRGIGDTEERLQNRQEKLKLIVHAEMNAVLNAARFGIPLKGCTLYLMATDNSGQVWGGLPCTRCMVEIIQSGISEIVSLPKRFVPSRWQEDLELSESLLKEAGVGYREVRPLSTGSRIINEQIEDYKGYWPKICLQRSFVEGAKWWQFYHNGSTMFSGEVDAAETEAIRRYGFPKEEL